MSEWTTAAAWIGAGTGIGNLLWNVHKERRAWRIAARDKLPLIRFNTNEFTEVVRVKLTITNRIDEELKISRLSMRRGYFVSYNSDYVVTTSSVRETAVQQSKTWDPGWSVNGNSTTSFDFAVSRPVHGPSIHLLLNSSLSTIRDKRVTLSLTKATIKV